MIAQAKKAQKDVNNYTTKVKKRGTAYIKSHPFVTLFSLLGLLVVLILISNFLQKPAKTAEETKPKAKKVEVYRIGQAPKITVQAQVEKSGVVTINALSPGVVSAIPVAAGDSVSRGTILISTATNYQGGNAPALQASLAARNLQNINETFDTQKDLIKKQKEMACKVDDNSDEMREINQKSIDETKALISLNNEILTGIDENINNAPNPAAALAQKQLKTQFLSANNQLNSSVRNTEYSSSDDNTPAEISNLQEDITKKQLDIQEKALDLNRDVSRLQLSIAQVQAAAMTPASPFAATVQRVFVKVGQAVQPGTPLVLLSQVAEEDPVVAIAYVPADIAKKASYLEPSVLSIGKFSYESFPTYISQEAVSGSLYAIYYPIPENYAQYVTDTGFINVKIPVGMFNTSSAIPYIPIDSVFQTQSESFVFVNKNGVATSKKVVLGNVIGSSVEVTSGLTKGDAIILNRDVISGDPVKIN